MATDESLMRQFQEGSKTAFEQIIRRWEKPMLTFFYRAVGDVDAAKDLRQELFFRLFARGNSYRGKGSFRAWLYSIAANLVRDHLKQARAFASATFSATRRRSDPAASADCCATAEAVARHNERARLVREMLDALSPKDREMLVLRFFGELPFDEIARVLGISTGTAKVRACRALQRLRRVADERGLSAGELL